MATNGQTTDLFEDRVGAELEDLRRSRDWTYLQLAEAIAAVTHRRRDEDCWRRICLGLTVRPHRRTLDILESFLGTERGPRTRRRANGRRRVA
jgi:hypothetical protein